MLSAADRAGARLIIDLAAIARNWRALKARIGAGVECAAVVKADAYGLGMARVAPALAAAGCRSFFVATLDEGLGLKRLVPEAAIYVLNGAMPGAEGEFAAAALVPVLNDLDAIARWAGEAGRRTQSLPAAIHLDTGMSRLGLSEREARRLAGAPDLLSGLAPQLVLSHLACAEDPGHEMNAAQRVRFAATIAGLPAMRASLANSSAILLGAAYHFDMVRPGAALYGINPSPAGPNPMAQVVRMQGKIIALRDVDRAMTVGYGATHRLARKGRIATIPVGYADGFPRALGNLAQAALAEPAQGAVLVPVVGRVSMDLITLDVSDVPADSARLGAWVDLIGGARPLDDVAAEAGTIAYEILTRLGARLPRLYVEDAAEGAR